jgi:multidrug resistance protein
MPTGRPRPVAFLGTPLGIVFSTVLLDLIGFGIVLPLLPLYAERFGASPVTIGLLTASYALAQLVFAPVWGRLSDRVGRRPVIMASLLGTCAASLMLGLAGSLWLLFVARVLDGISGASYAAAQAYVADVTAPEDRARGMGLIGAAFGLGFVIGPALGALCAAADPRLPFFVAAGLAAANLVAAWYRLPESRRPGLARARSRWSALSAALADRRLAPLVWLSFLGNFGFVAMEATFALFGERRFDFGLTQTGLVFAYIGVVAAVVQGAGVGPVVRRYGEGKVMLAGLAGTAVALALLAACHDLWALIPVLGLLAGASGLAFATVTALVSQRAGAHVQGETLGVLAAVGSLARVTSPVVATALLQHVGIGSPFVLGAALFVVCLWLGARTLSPRPGAHAGGVETAETGTCDPARSQGSRAGPW